MMGTTLDEKLAALPVKRRKRILAEADRLEAEYVTLRDLRKALDLTQVELAKKLGKSQVTIAKMEKRHDLLLSTLRSTIEAMGGKLSLSVEFPGGAPVYLSGLGHSAEAAPPE
ncbi:MAG: helix-turn-helix domain-containing protein [Robiginitomaculum sp.]|nr:helix-turn-helix domain-containing protein [Robiginitomaculum sp.]